VALAAGPNSHDPQSWVWGMGRFDLERWRSSWEELFATHEMIHNHRRTVHISISPEQVGAFAVVDVDTLWRHRDDGSDQHWNGRACKLYTLVVDEWKLIAHRPARLLLRRGALSWFTKADRRRTHRGWPSHL
jgi:hypothetical protein